MLQEDREDVRREVQVLNLVSDHPHVAELIEVFEDAKAIHLVLELCKGGELFDRVVSKGTFTERMAAGSTMSAFIRVLLSPATGGYVSCVSRCPAPLVQCV